MKPRAKHQGTTKFKFKYNTYNRTKEKTTKDAIELSGTIDSDFLGDIGLTIDDLKHLTDIAGKWTAGGKEWIDEILKMKQANKGTKHKETKSQLTQGTKK